MGSGPDASYGDADPFPADPTERNGVTMSDVEMPPSGVLAVLPCADVDSGYENFTNVNSSQW